MRGSVLLADDHAVSRGSVRADLEELGYDVCGEVGDANAAVAVALIKHPDVALLDVRMPGDGIEAARLIHEQLPDTRIVMLTVSRDEDDVRAAVGAGAVGYVLKDVEAERLAAALDAVVAGETVLPPLASR
jgi:DNA-binding NarL/FixJ family response regulator